ncbi:enoyl-CoA hydratase/isomerase family protein [Humibacter sp.]|uniref:enoyl-CoA hydratase/isomerase family protein n=1 Tax=Humibacter sp. TaxID=1940291 RepID=UPI002B54469E|nr:enoyl-CoA hydratase-related protein [Humibacter sp.]HVX09160.1 enoyl-CoA hydratase-related protein [Humibacter sp.]
MYESVEGLDIEVSGDVLTVTLNAPERRNALTDQSVSGLIRALETASTDESLRAIALTGAGDHFCGGFDIVGRNRTDGARPRTGSIQRRIPVASGRVISLLLTIQLPVVCAVRGWAVGIGAQLALAADITVASDDARIWWPFLDRGFTPDSASTWLLPRLVGPVRARQLLLLAREISGAEAAAMGAVALAVPSSRVSEAAEEVLARLAAGPTVALGLTKSLLATTWDHGLSSQLAAEAHAMELSSRSPDFREGLSALSEKRPPEFRGR